MGRATSFYNERNEGLGPDLVNILLEAEQPVPDFLEHFKPEDGKPEFNDDTDDEEEENDGVEPDNGVKPDGGLSTEAAVEDGTWGTKPATSNAGDWGTPATPAEAPAAW